MTTITDFDEEESDEEGSDSQSDMSSVHSDDSAPYVEAKRARKARWDKDTEDDIWAAEAAAHSQRRFELLAMRGPCSWFLSQAPRQDRARSL